MSIKRTDFVLGRQKILIETSQLTTEQSFPADKQELSNNNNCHVIS